MGLRERLTADRLDAGLLTLQWHLAQQGLTPSDASGPAAPTSASRPPNTGECWQPDVTRDPPRTQGE